MDNTHSLTNAELGEILRGWSGFVADVHAGRVPPASELVGYPNLSDAALAAGLGVRARALGRFTAADAAGT